MSPVRMDFFVVGAQKAGTTALHDMLNAHSEIALPKQKETHFFSHAGGGAKGIEWYLDQFQKRAGTQLVGEIDPEYMFAPGAAEAIRRATTARKFIFLLRHPLERAFSHFLMTRSRGFEQLEFGAALSVEERRLRSDRSQFAHDHWSYCARSRYSGQIAAYQRAFPDGEFLFVLSKQLADPGDTGGYARICRFIGTEPRDLGAAGPRRRNVASAPRSHLLRDLLYAPHGKTVLRRGLMRLVPTNVKLAAFRLLDSANKGPVDIDRSAQFTGIPREIVAAMISDLARTEALTGLDLSAWLNDLEAHQAGSTPFY